MFDHQVDDFVGEAASPVGEEPDDRSTDPDGVADLPCRAVICGDAIEVGYDEIASVDRVAVVPKDLERVIGRLVRVVAVREKGREPVRGDPRVDCFDPPPLPFVEKWAGDVDEWRSHRVIVPRRVRPDDASGSTLLP